MATDNPLATAAIPQSTLPGPLNKLTPHLKATLDWLSVTFGNHKRNNQLCCVLQIVFCIVLLVEASVTVPDLPSGFEPTNANWKVAPEGFDGRWLWYFQLFVSLTALLGTNSKYGVQYQLHYTVLYLSVTMVISWVACVYFMNYGNYWQTGEIMCGTERQLVCSDSNWSAKLLGQRWLWRFATFLPLQFVCVHPTVTYVIDLLSQRKAKQQ
ncbi:hypothetical protein BC828DRAFT_388381 [Blastocladiella britannica]|nr:hypothetical protein BC828DRAFT_388381 [Blastocladiella britannica]